MAILNCLWIGALAGLVAGRLVRGGRHAPLASSVAVGVLGALLGELAHGWLGSRAHGIPHSDLAAAGVGATAALLAWFAAQRMLLTAPRNEKPAEGG